MDDVPRRPALFQEQVEGELDLRERGDFEVILEEKGYFGQGVRYERSFLKKKKKRNLVFMRKKREGACVIFSDPVYRDVHDQFMSEFLCRSFEKVAWKLSGLKTSAVNYWFCGMELR